MRDRRPGRAFGLRARYEQPVSWPEALRRVRESSARTVILDVEPLLAIWDAGRQTLEEGLAAVVPQVAKVPGVQVICVATNSRRPRPKLPQRKGLTTAWIATAGKPLRTAPYRDFPRPGVVIGDQVATDGVLAWRLGYAFVHYRPELDRIPAGPWVMDRLGRLIRPLLFTRRR